MPTLQQQKQFFEAFGFLTLPGLLRDDIGWITEEFEAVFTGRGIAHDEMRRSIIVPFIDQREKLCTLLDHPLLLAPVKNLLGADFNYAGGDGNFYTGDTMWHSDGFHHVGLFLKVALYLDPVKRESGCLRVLPGSHRMEARPFWEANKPARAEEMWGVQPSALPDVALESQPGDVVVFNHNLWHAAFGGGTRRRMFTLNLCRRCDTPEEIADLEDYIAGGARFQVDSMHGEKMRTTAAPERWKHLRQVEEHEAHLPALSAKVRERGSELARG